MNTDWVLLDIERKRVQQDRWEISEIALVNAEGDRRLKYPDRSELNCVLDQIEQAEVIVGHNIRRHDLPELYKAARRQQPASLDEKICDTLELSSLFFPGKPKHSLNKKYREELGLSDPVEDAWESYKVYIEAHNVRSKLPLIVRHWAWRLLSKGYPRKLIPGYVQPPEQREWWDDLQRRCQGLNVQGLRDYLTTLPRQIDSLGAVVFLNWLYQLNQPEARRPAWLEQQFATFRKAEEYAFPLPLDKDQIKAELQYFFGLPDFRDGQLEIIQALLRGEVVPLGVLPTGGGKSITFQLPALILSRYRRGLSIIVSPLQALMADQVQSLKEKLEKQKLRNYTKRVELLAGTQDIEQQHKVIESVWKGQVDILYLSPERLRHPTIQRILRHRLPHLWILDEAHTLSQWGHDFRPDFMRITQLIKEFYENSTPPLIGFVTATVTSKVFDDLDQAVNEKLGSWLGRSLQRLPGEERFRWREEIETYVRMLPQPQRLDKVKQCLKERIDSHLETHQNQGVAIVYVPTRRMAEKYANELTETGFKAEAFHSRIKSDKKARVIQDFKSGELNVVVATNAFGMGIDREGIHTVIHVSPPATPEAYLQEIGRAARQKGEHGCAYLFWEEKDFDWIFEQESRCQISQKALQNCWLEVIKPQLYPNPSEKGKNREAWVSVLDLAKPLGQEDMELLATQARVALYYLEKAKLIQEKESCPSHLHICIERFGTKKLHHFGKRIESYLQKTIRVPLGQGIDIDVREVALATELRPSEVIKGVCQLVNAEAASWHYQISLKLNKQVEKKLQHYQVSVEAFLEWLAEQSPPMDGKRSIELNTQSLEEDLQRIKRERKIKYSVKLKDSLLVLTRLNLAYYRYEEAYTVRFYLEEHETLTHWLPSARKICGRVWQEIGAVQQVLSQIFNHKQEQEESYILDVADLEKHLTGEQSIQNTALEVLETMKRLDLVVFGCSALGSETLYRLVSGQNKQPGSWADAYQPLEDHYNQRGRRIHAIREVLLAENNDPKSQDARIEVLRKYFTLTLEEFDREYFKGIEGFPKAPIGKRILEGLNETQQRIVRDYNSRALLVLAGPGSGKTHTIVRRVGYLVSTRSVPPQQILVLAYNRSAAVEVRKRLHQLLGNRGTLVDALTFHALAAKLTGLRSRDVPQEVQGEKRFQWLLKQAIEYLQTNHPGYQYILVDEYQDIDELQYQMITLLAGFDRQDEDESQKSFLVAVGDDDQNLYEWRDAKAEFIRRFRQDYKVGDDAVAPLLINYRSRPSIVDFTNRFIETAIAPQNRLKETNQRMQSVRTEQPGKVSWGEYSHPHHAAEWIAEKIADILTDPKIPREKIAVLAHRWDDLRYLQHLLRERWGDDREIAYQFYSNKDKLSPANSRVGQAVIQCLSQNHSLVISNPKAHLENLCLELGYSARDTAWSALLHTLEDCSEMTQEEIVYRLKASRPLRPGLVILSTFHSAKGSEFNYVFVLEEGSLDRNKLESHARELYVGFTRAREELYVLFTKDENNRHPELHNVLTEINSPTVVQIQIPEVELPHKIQYHLFLEPDDLFLSEHQIIEELGQRQVETYAREWGELNLKIDWEWHYGWDEDRKIGIKDARLHYKSQTVAVLSKKGREKLWQRVRHGRQVFAQGYTVFQVERDDNFYQRADYQGDADHHYVVLPYFEVEGL